LARQTVLGPFEERILSYNILYQLSQGKLCDVARHCNGTPPVHSLGTRTKECSATVNRVHALELELRFHYPVGYRDDAASCHNDRSLIDYSGQSYLNDMQFPTSYSKSRISDRMQRRSCRDSALIDVLGRICISKHWEMRDFIVMAVK